MNLTLTKQQKQELENQHSTARDGRVRDRIKAVLLASEGWSAAMISQALRIHESTVLRHLKDYEQSEKLKPENGGSISRLSGTQTMELIEHLSEFTYHHTFQIVTYVQERFGVQYTVSGMYKWLNHNGFSYKKPKGIPHKFEESRQREFIDAYETLKANLGENESILFIDAVHPTQATKITHGWIRKGQDKSLETTGSRSRINIVGALNLSDISATVVEDYERVNGESIVHFFCKIRERYPEMHKLHLVLDGAGYHRSELVKNTAAELNIELHYLPPYSPNLNPIERLWKVMNEHARNNRYFSSKREFREALTNFFDVTLPEIAGSLASRLNDNFQVLKSASSS